MDKIQLFFVLLTKFLNLVGQIKSLTQFQLCLRCFWHRESHTKLLRSAWTSAICCTYSNICVCVLGFLLCQYVCDLGFHWPVCSVIISQSTINLFFATSGFFFANQNGLLHSNDRQRVVLVSFIDCIIIDCSLLLLNSPINYKRSLYLVPHFSSYSKSLLTWYHVALALATGFARLTVT